MGRGVRPPRLVRGGRLGHAGACGAQPPAHDRGRRPPLRRGHGRARQGAGMSEPRALHFTEEMKGWLSFDQTDFNQALLHGRREGTRAKLRLTIEIGDLARFLDPARTHEARAHGHLECDALGGRLETQAGGFELFSTEGGARHLRMRYRLALRNPAGYALTLHGFKLVEDDPNFDSWHDVTTLFVRLHAGHVDEGAQQPDEPVAPDGPVATGVLRVTPFTLARQLMSYRGRLSSVNRFQAFFL